MMNYKAKIAARKTDQGNIRGLAISIFCEAIFRTSRNLLTSPRHVGKFHLWTEDLPSLKSCSYMLKDISEDKLNEKTLINFLSEWLDTDSYFEPIYTFLRSGPYAAKLLEYEDDTWALAKQLFSRHTPEIKGPSTAKLKDYILGLILEAATSSREAIDDYVDARWEDKNDDDGGGDGPGDPPDDPEDPGVDISISDIMDAPTIDSERNRNLTREKAPVGAKRINYIRKINAKLMILNGRIN